MVAAFPGAARVFNVQVNNTVGVSLQYGALYIGGPIVSYYTGAQSFSAGFAASSATNLNLNATQEPTCLVDYAAVWARSSSVEMWSVSGGINYETDTTEIVHSSDGFATSFRVVPTITTAGATLRNRRAGGGVRLVNGTGYQGNTTLMWGGNTDDNVGDAAIYITQDDFITISRPRTNAAPVPCPFPACTTSPVYARMAYAVCPSPTTSCRRAAAATGCSAAATCTSAPTRRSAGRTTRAPSRRSCRGPWWRCSTVRRCPAPAPPPPTPRSCCWCPATRPRPRG